MDAAPKPDNWDDLCAAWSDAAAFDREKARYQRQLREAGIRSLGRDFTEPTRPNLIALTPVRPADATAAQGKATTPRGHLRPLKRQERGVQE